MKATDREEATAGYQSAARCLRQTGLVNSLQAIDTASISTGEGEEEVENGRTWSGPTPEDCFRLPV